MVWGGLHHWPPSLNLCCSFWEQQRWSQAALGKVRWSGAQGVPCPPAGTCPCCGHTGGKSPQSWQRFWIYFWGCLLEAAAVTDKVTEESRKGSQPGKLLWGCFRSFACQGNAPSRSVWKQTFFKKIGKSLLLLFLIMCPAKAPEGFIRMRPAARQPSQGCHSQMLGTAQMLWRDAPCKDLMAASWTLLLNGICFCSNDFLTCIKKSHSQFCHPQSSGWGCSRELHAFVAASVWSSKSAQQHGLVHLTVPNKLSPDWQKNFSCQSQAMFLAKTEKDKLKSYVRINLFPEHWREWRWFPMTDFYLNYVKIFCSFHYT